MDSRTETLTRLYSAKREIEDAIDVLEEDDDIQPPVGQGDRRTPQLALVVGHTARSPGAYSPIMEIAEYPYNKELAHMILDYTPPVLVDCEIFYRDGRGIAKTYAAVKEWGADACIELHFNSVESPRVSGTETIYFTDASRPFAMAVQKAMVEALGLPDRGIRLPWNGRGTTSLTSLQVPSIITEPFFARNPDDCRAAVRSKEKLAKTISSAATDYIVEHQDG